jgi:hypothetical protein
LSEKTSKPKFPRWSRDGSRDARSLPTVDLQDRSPWRGKGARYVLPERPGGGFAQNVPGPFSPPRQRHLHAGQGSPGTGEAQPRATAVMGRGRSRSHPSGRDGRVAVGLSALHQEDRLSRMSQSALHAATAA